jgi:ABC-2 type transport system permease protein
LTRAVQPVLWMVIFGETFTKIHAIPTGHVPYLAFLAPGIIAQSGLFVAIFYGIQIIWERDAGVLTKLLVTPTPRSALIVGKSFAAGIRALAQVVVVLVLSAVLGVDLTSNPLRILGAFLIVMLGAAFFSCLSMTVAGVVLKRDRLMGIGQMITMPLFFASDALYPVKIMPGWLQALSKVNPLSYEVDGLRGLLIGTPAHLGEDFLVLVIAVVIGVTTAASLVRRLAQ